MSLPKILHRERIYIPTDSITPLQQEAIEKRFSKVIYNEQTCSKCEYKHDRPSETCDNCPANMGEFKLHQTRRFNDIEYTGIPQGAMKFFHKHFDHEEFKIVDKRPRTKFMYDIEFTGTLREHQIPAVAVLINHYKENGGTGTLVAPPRSGKSPMAVAAFCQLGLKTLIIAKQADWLHQFYETMCGSESQKALTNIPDIEKFQ